MGVTIFLCFHEFQGLVKVNETLHRKSGYLQGSACVESRDGDFLGLVGPKLFELVAESARIGPARQAPQLALSIPMTLGQDHQNTCVHSQSLELAPHESIKQWIL